MWGCVISCSVSGGKGGPANEGTWVTYPGGGMQTLWYLALSCETSIEQNMSLASMSCKIVCIPALASTYSCKDTPSSIASRASRSCSNIMSHVCECLYTLPSSFICSGSKMSWPNMAALICTCCEGLRIKPWIIRNLLILNSSAHGTRRQCLNTWTLVIVVCTSVSSLCSWALPIIITRMYLHSFMSICLHSFSR